jgi:hypothetical protein
VAIADKCIGAHSQFDFDKIIGNSQCSIQWAYRIASYAAINMVGELNVACKSARYGTPLLLNIILSSGVKNTWSPLNMLTIARIAAEHGNIECVKVIRAHGCKWTDSASNNNAGIIEWARSAKCPWTWTRQPVPLASKWLNDKAPHPSSNLWELVNTQISYFNSTMHHINNMQWAREQRCPWTNAMCDAAVRGNQPEILQWLRSDGCV